MNIINQGSRILTPENSEQAIRLLQQIEYAGRNCYDSCDNMTENSYKLFIKKLLQNGHMSPIEFGTMTVELVTGRDVMAEITRHRVASFAIKSQRYVLEDKYGTIDFIKPLFAKDKENHEQYLRWQNAMEHCEKVYKSMIAVDGCKPQDARKVLPNSTATSIVMSANLREWRHIFTLRTSDKAYPEMQDVMKGLLLQAKLLFPIVFDDIG